MYYRGKILNREKYSDPTWSRLTDWSWISKEYDLPEDFIREHADKVDWHWISCKQKLSKEFIREFADKVEWDFIVKYQGYKEFK